jgi:hypothetical protein
MLKGAWVILKCRVQIGLRAVARIACLGEQGKVRKGQTGRQGAVCRTALLRPTGREPGVDEGASEADEQADACQQDPLTARQHLQTEGHEPDQRAELR